MNKNPLRKIRSFVRREGRLTQAQERAITELWSKFGADFRDDPLTQEMLYPLVQEWVIEIGFGNGESLVQMAQDNLGINYLGFEVHRPGVGHCLIKAEALGLKNLRVSTQDVSDIIEQGIPEHGLSGVQIFFPDPWHKKRHNKRRLIQEPFLALLAKKLKPGGFLHIATDWADYAEHAADVMKASPQFINQANEGDFIPRPDSRPITKFEQRGLKLGHKIFDLYYLTK